MRSIFIISIFFCAFLSADAQETSWANSFGGDKVDVGNDITSDNEGNVYTVGQFTEYADFDPGIGTFHIASPGTSGFIQKTDSEGNFLWAQRVGEGNAGNTQMWIVKTDAEGNIYVFGMVWGSMDFAPGVESLILTSAGDYDFFIQKLDSDGNLIYAKVFGGVYEERIFDVDFDVFDNIYISGFYYDTTVLDNQSDAGTISGPNNFINVFILKVDNNGNFIWVKNIGGEDYEDAQGIHVSDSGSVLITGAFYDTVDFDPGEDEFILEGDNWAKSYILKLDSDGNFIWARGITGAGEIVSYDIQTDSDENIYMTGIFTETFDIDPSPEEFLLTIGEDETRNAFIQKLDADGNFLWANQLGGFSNDGQDIAIDNNDNVYWSGRFYHNLIYTAGGDDINISDISSSFFTAEIENDGSIASLFIKGISPPGSGSFVYSGMCLDPANNFLYTGYFSDETMFDADNIISTDGSADVFTAKVNNNLNVNNHNLTPAPDFQVFPNPNNGVFTLQTSEVISEISIQNAIGQNVLHQKIQNNTVRLNNFPSGIYYLTASTNSGKTGSQKIIIYD